MLLESIMSKESLEHSIHGIDIWLTVFAVIVVIGVGGECIFGWINLTKHRALEKLQNSEDQQLRLQIEGFKSDNLKLELQLAQTRSEATDAAYAVYPRRILDCVNSGERLAAFSGINVRVNMLTSELYEMGSGNIQDDVRQMIAKSKWKVLDFSFSTNAFFGVSVEVHPPLNNDPAQLSKLEKAAFALWNELNFNGVTTMRVGVFDRSNDSDPDTTGEGYIALKLGQRFNLTADRVWRGYWHEIIHGETNSLLRTIQ
jgi:hypothetical protein